MLTKTDLQAIDNLIVKRVDEVVTKRIREEHKPIRKDISKMRKDIDVMLSLFDREYVNLRSRVERIEEHLSLTPMSA